MNNWKEVSLKDYCKTQYGYTASATDNNTGVKFVRITDIVPDFVDWNKVPYCEISEKDFKKYKLNEGDIVAARTGATVGYAKQIRKGSPDAVFASYLVKLIPSEEVDKHFLGVLIESNVYREFIQIIAGGSAQPNANANDLTLFKFFLPPVPTQQRIASILSAYDDLIEVNNHRIKLLDETARELYKEWFVRMRFPKYQNAKFKKGIPTDWRIEPIGKIIDYNIGGGWGNDNKDNQFSVAGYVIRGTDIPKVRAGQANQDVYRFHKASNMKSRELIEGDIVFETAGGSEGQPLGRTCYITQEMLDAYGDKVMAASFCKQIRTTSIPSLYLYYFLNYLYDTGMIEAYQVQSTGISNYQFEPFLKFQQIILPKDELMQSFHDKAILMQKQIAILGQQNTQLRQIRDRLLPRLISGKLEVKPNIILKQTEQD